MKRAACTCLGLWAAVVAADLAPRQTAAPSTTQAAPEITAVTSCHPHGTDLYCMNGSDEYLVNYTPTATTSGSPAEFTDCHPHGADLYCIAPDGQDVEVLIEGEEAHTEEGESEEDHDDHEEEEESGSGVHCHFHAGREHCVGGDAAEQESTCQSPSRDYNVGLRVGLLFVIMATSAIGVFAPIFLQRIWPHKLNKVFLVLKQFGTGIIISTAFVHLYTHAALMFTDECVGDLGYEAVTSAIVMAGIFLSFLVEYIGHRVVRAKIRSEAVLTVAEKNKAVLSSQVTSILVMEAGIVFHSILIGLTLVVAGDSFFLTLFVVILFHQMFEGIALGSRISTIGIPTAPVLLPSSGSHASGHETEKSAQPTEEQSVDSSISSEPPIFALSKKLGLAALFAFITPIGMAIGIGVLNQFNGGDPATLIAIGTLDAISAGILVWVGVVEMWAADWMTGAHGRPAELADADLVTVLLAMFGLMTGLALMSVLGIWA
ncbi:hypothetical protein S7711_02155 [Stachybotrys chartarum IBT 7711]|uniref:Uncharacterized protein n=1 Tax=Stachybotrys chartarum (strain CBS 109288 / IBT 7711) TaxID=1280523 RepID=A0A084ARL8_STACB|nr:hypothetical protein S7711_02155 [Stachybotrys chartarum IBT 7711]KFA48064.1 hypothetical protein S40293_02677 [Stachybotrys chartarum IBT 40293]